jgi:hypothetical protein
MVRRHLSSLLAVAFLGSLVSACHTVASPKCSEDADCDDGVYCNGTETCDQSTKKCKSGTAPKCDDSVDCTADVCDEASKACAHVPDSTKCAVGQACSATGCVSSCPSCDDGVACTLDVCNPVTGGCAHVPDDSKCSDGQKCDATGGCISTCDDAACLTACVAMAGISGGTCDPTGYCLCTPVTTGSVTGVATLLGLASASAGIAVTLVGSSHTPGATSDAGQYTINTVPAGVYSLAFSKSGYSTVTLGSIVVNPNATTLVDPVVIEKATLVADLGRDTVNSNFQFSPAGAAVVIRTTGPTAGTTRYTVAPSDASSAPVLAVPVGGNYVGMNDQDVLSLESWGAGYSWFAKKLGDTSAIAALGVLPMNGYTFNGGKSIVGIQQICNPSTCPYEFWILPQDGSAGPTRFYNQPATESVSSYTASNTLFVYQTAPVPAAASAAIHFKSLDPAVADPATWTPGTYFSFSGYLVLTNDKSWVLGDACVDAACTNKAWFLVHLTGAERRSFTTANYLNSIWTASDSSGYVIRDSANGWWVWPATAAAPTAIAWPAAGLYDYNSVGRAFWMIDTAGGNRELRWASFDNTAAATLLDTWPASNYRISVQPGATNLSTRICWQPVGQNYVKTAALGAAPSAAVNLSTLCPAFEMAQLLTAGDACFWVETCNGTGNPELHALLPGAYTTDVKLDSDVAGIIGDFPDAGRILYTDKAGAAWSITYAGTGKARVTSMPLIPNRYSAQSQWLFYYDSAAQLTRVSRINGTTIDVPLTSTDVNFNNYILLSPDKGNVWMGGPYSVTSNRVLQIPVSRLP